jgi:hypothetical protein
MPTAGASHLTKLIPVATGEQGVARAFNARDTLVMRRSLVSDEDPGAEAPTALRGTLLKSAEAYH